VTGNSASDVAGSLATDNHNLIGAAAGPALLGQMGSYGGPTWTIPLLPGSPAIGAGDPAVCANTAGSAPVAGVDQRGVTRPTGTCDIGAFQSQGFTLSEVSGDNQEASPGSTFANP